MRRLRRVVLVGVILIAALPSLAAARGPASPAPGDLVEVVVELGGPGAAHSALPRSRGRLDLDAAATLRRLTRLAVEQELVEQRIREAVPGAEVRWRYRVVLNALAVVVPAGAADRLAAVPGVREVYASARYGPSLDRSPAAVGAPALWGPALSSAGQGMKIGIIDDGVDHRHPFFSPAGYAMPAGFPKGQTAYTTAKVIVARVFPARSPRPRNAHLPLDPEHSEHATHVAGIAAGNHGTQTGGSGSISGVAPRAYIGNYRALTVPTVSNLGLNGNSPEIAAAVEAAVRDGMDVINLSLGEPEIDPRRDLVVRAIEGAAAAGVVPVVAAGNDHDVFGAGSVLSPATAPSAITTGAAMLDGRMARFSSAGPTPISSRLKPELTAPGVSILSSVPAQRGLWEAHSGTSMAAPHVAGAAALLRQRHPGWRVSQLKSALVQTARRALDGSSEARATRQGGGFVDLARADRPLIFADPTAISFGLIRSGRSVVRRIALADAGGGGGAWTVSLALQSRVRGISLSAAGQVSVPGRLAVRATARRGAGGEVTGFVVLSRAGETRRLPFWLRAATPRLGRHRARALRRTGTYRGNTRGRRALVSVYRYPEDPRGVGVERLLAGPEQVFRVRLRRPVANFGVAIVSRGRGSRVQPRIVRGSDENRQAGSTALPVNTNAYLPTFYEPEPVSGVVRPAAGTYHVVFDSPTRSGAGRFTFRFWIGDTTPPRVRIVSRSVRSGGALVALASDRGSGVNPRAIFASVDGNSRAARFDRRRGRIAVHIGNLASGRHRLVLWVSDHQEAKNNENALRILPNTTILAASFTVR